MGLFSTTHRDRKIWEEVKYGAFNVCYSQIAYDAFEWSLLTGKQLHQWKICQVVQHTENCNLLTLNNLYLWSGLNTVSKCCKYDS